MADINRNFRLAVRVNGLSVFPVGSGSDATGMFRRFWYDLGSISESSSLELTVFPPNNPGNTSNTCKACGQGGNHELAKDVTAQYMGGWDWIQGTPDRNTGIFGCLSITQASVLVTDVTTRVDLPQLDYPVATSAANLTFTLALLNLQKTSLRVRVEVSVADLNLTVSQTFLLSSSSDWVDLTLPRVTVLNATLWYPFSMGVPFLYTAIATVSHSSGLVHSHTWRLGVRTVDSQVDLLLGGRVFFVNQQPLFIHGGNYIAPDQLNRYTGRQQVQNKSRYYFLNTTFLQVLCDNLPILQGAASSPRGESKMKCAFTAKQAST